MPVYLGASAFFRSLARAFFAAFVSTCASMCECVHGGMYCILCGRAGVRSCVRSCVWVCEYGCMGVCSPNIYF